MKEIDPQDLTSDDLILDVRRPFEHEKMSLAAPHWFVPLEQLKLAQFVKEHNLDGSKTLNILCRTGKRAAVAAEKFKRLGFKNVAVIKGGILNAQKEGLLIIRYQTLSINRQIRLTAGLIVLIGLIAGLWMPPFLWLSALMGIGLVLSGITGRCALGDILCKMPWNK